MPFPEKPSNVRLLRLFAGGLLVGAAFGAVEMALEFIGETDPSVLRREWFLVCYSVALNAVIGALLFVIAGLIARFARARDPRAVFAGLAVACLISGALFATTGNLLGKGYGTASRIGAVLAVAALAAVLGFLTARILSKRPDGVILRTLAAILRPWPVLAVSAIALVVTSAGVLLLGGEARAGDDFAESESAAANPRQPVRVNDERPNIILVVVDTLRADGLGVYSGGAGKTPAIDRLAASGTLFERATAEAPWTLPSVVSILTSSYPHDHGFVDFDGNVPDSLDSLPKSLHQAGYECRAIVGNPLLSEERGCSAGYDFYDVYGYRLESRLFASRVFSGIVRMSGVMGSVDLAKNPVLWFEPARFPFISTRLSFYVQDEDLNDRLFRYSGFPAGASSPSGRPLFLYVQYVAPHTPYLEHPYRFIKSQPELIEANHKKALELYAGAVTYADTVFDDLWTRLKSAGVLDNAIVVFTADHGEEFLEHGRWEHGHSLYQEVLHVPLIFQGPGIIPGVRIDRRVPLLDVAPTLLDFAGVPVPKSFRGESLHAGLTASGEPGDSSAGPRPLFSELSSRYLNKNADFTSAISDNWKIIRRRKPAGELAKQEIFDLSSDSGEKTTITDLPDALKSLEQELIAFEQESDAARKARSGVTLTGQELEKMRALGYIK